MQWHMPSSINILKQLLKSSNHWSIQSVYVVETKTVIIMCMKLNEIYGIFPCLAYPPFLLFWCINGSHILFHQEKAIFPHVVFDTRTSKYICNKHKYKYALNYLRGLHIVLGYLYCFI